MDRPATVTQYTGGRLRSLFALWYGVGKTSPQKLISFSVQMLLSPSEWHLSVVDSYQYIRLMSVCPYSTPGPLAIQSQSHPIPAGPGSLILTNALDVWVWSELPRTKDSKQDCWNYVVHLWINAIICHDLICQQSGMRWYDTIWSKFNNSMT